MVKLKKLILRILGPERLKRLLICLMSIFRLPFLPMALIRYCGIHVNAITSMYLPPPPPENEIKNTPINIELPEGYYPMHFADFRVIPVLNTNGEIYRYVPPSKSTQYRQVISRMDAAGLLGNEFIWVEECDELLMSHPNSLLLKCEKLVPLFIWTHYPPKMIRSYCIWLLEFIEKLDNAGLGVDCDAPQNATYCNGKFVYFDLGSINLQKTSNASMNGFILHFLNKLVLISCGEYDGFYEAPWRPVDYPDMKNYMTPGMRIRYMRLIKAVEYNLFIGDVNNACTILKSYVSSLSMPTINTDWSNYCSETLLKIPYGFSEELHQKYRGAIELIRKVNPRSMIDIAGNQGFLALMLKNELENAIVIDVDIGALDSLWHFMDSNDEYTGSNIIPVRHNLLRPPPSAERIALFQLKYGDKVTPFKNFFEENEKCEIAVCLSIIHHIVFGSGLSFDELLSCILNYTYKYLVIEFIDIQDVPLKQSYPNHADYLNWYTQENFEKALSNHFRILEVILSFPDTRSLYLCEIV